MSSEIKNFTYDDIQREAETFAANYRKAHDVPPLPGGNRIQKYQDIIKTNYSRVTGLIKKRLESVDSEGGHGYEHLEDIATRAGFIADKECSFRKISKSQQDLIVNEAILAGLLHDIERHLGFGEGHAIEGEKTAGNILKEVGIESEIVTTVVRNHDDPNYNPANNLTLEIAFGSVFDADHFRYGLEREDTFWRMKEKKGKTAAEVIHDYQFLPGYLHVWKTTYGKEVGPKYIEFGLAIAKHVEEVFSK